MRPNPAVSSLALLTALLATTLPASAQQTTLDTLRISAGGLTPFEEKQLGRSYTVIGSDQIQLSGTAYVADLLRQVPGLAVSRGGSFAGKTQIRVRGAEGNQVLVLIDGVPTSETSDGEFDFARLQVSNVERIEILRGPQSAFWGANAMAGVINIVTKSADASGLTGSLAGETGTDGTKMTSGTLAYGQDNFDISGGVTLRSTDGYNVAAQGNELDGATHIDANGRFRAEITPQLTLDGTVRYARLYGDADEQDFLTALAVDSADTTAINELSGALGLGWVSDDALWFQNARVSGGTVERRTVGTGFEVLTTGDRYKLSYQAGRNFDTPGFLDAKHTVTLGYDLVQETFEQIITPLERRTRTTHSLVGEYRGTYLDQFYLTAALRQDFNDVFVDATTYSVSGAWQIPDTGTRLHASLGTGSTNPTFYEQYGYIPGFFTPNPNLKPETSFGWDVGVEQSLLDGMVVVDATYFNQNLENAITGTAQSVKNTVGISTRQGLELSANVNIMGGLTAGVTYTYVDARTPAGLREIRRPQHSGSINLAYKLDEIPLTLNGEVLLVGETTDTAFIGFGQTTVSLPAYTVVNAGLNYQLNDQVEIYGRVQNLFDTKYQEVYGYNTQGRTFYAGARAKF
ncbi:MAG: TonB-dependent receptor plug domain-containing protein [Devosia sp.]